MACAQVIGLDTAIATAAQDNRFQLATMLPLIAFNLLQQLGLLGGVARALHKQTIARLEVATGRLLDRSRRNVMLVTALTPYIGYDLAGRIAKAALEQERPVIDVAREMTELSAAELERLLDPARMARPHGAR